jgi:elongation factor G
MARGPCTSRTPRVTPWKSWRRTDADTLERVRNIGVIAHIDAGKTTTTEHLLFYAGAKHTLGSVDDGNSTPDCDPEERQRGITIYSACVSFEWRSHTIHLIDTPGHIDFTAEVERSLRVLDGAVVLFDAQKGVEAQSGTVWRQADNYGVPRLVFVNKMDVLGADFGRTLDSIQRRLTPDCASACRPVPVVIPLGHGGPSDSPNPFRGVIDLVEMKALFFDADDLGRTVRPAAIPEEYLEEARRHRRFLLDVLTQNDDSDLIISRILDGHEPAPEKLRQLLREQCLARQVYPVLCGSGREHIGIQPLLDAIVDYLPSPLDRPAVTGTKPRGNMLEKRQPDPQAPFCGLVFKVVQHEHGNRFLIRVYSGTLMANMRVYNPGKDVKENIARLFHVNADPTRRLEEVTSGPAGDIVCVIGLQHTATGDTLCDTRQPILLEAITFAEAVVSQSIEPESRADRDELALALHMIHLEDPTFLVKEDSGQTVMSGMGMLHLEIKRRRLERDFGLRVRVGKPGVSYREMLREPRTIDAHMDKLGDRSAFAMLKVLFTNDTADKLVTVRNEVDDGENVVPPTFLAAAERALAESLQTGPLGYPMMHTQAHIFDAGFDPQLSSAEVFVAAAVRAYREATRDNVQLLEPIMKVTVTTPSEYVGKVFGDLSGRGGAIEKTITTAAGQSEVVAKVPLRKLSTYANDLRSLSQGWAAAGMEPHSYQPAPPEVLRGLLEECSNTSRRRRG